MLTLAALHQQLEKKGPSMDQWDPPFCGDIDIRIQADGRWLYQSSPIGRISLVRLFASVLVWEQGEYFLKTPVEKVRIQVDDSPYIIQSWRWEVTEQGRFMVAMTNLQDEVILSTSHPVYLRTYQQQPLPYVALWRGLSARVGRNVFYQWVSEALAQTVAAPTNELTLLSGDYVISLGAVAD